MRIGDTVTLDGMDDTPYAIIAKAPNGWWIQNLHTGALPMHSWALNGYRAKNLKLVGRYIEWSKSA